MGCYVRDLRSEGWQLRCWLLLLLQRWWWLLLLLLQ
jgi:hypothetical protein